MQRVEIAGYSGTPIHSLDDWAKYAMPPARHSKHWREGRRAYELGWAWTLNGAPAVPAELQQLLESHEATRGTVIIKGWTEHETALPPPGSRGPRCHDLALIAEQGGRHVTICIEAKADEPFGGTVAEEFQRAKERQGSQFPDRLDWLSRSLLGLPAFNDGDRNTVSEQVRDLPYQLLTAMVGTLVEAKAQSSTTAVFVVHEFRTTLTTDVKTKRNARELDNFLRLLLRQNGTPDDIFQLRCGQLSGPLPMREPNAVDGLPLPHGIPLFVGKIRTQVKGKVTGP